jgi:hypothetical protein
MRHQAMLVTRIGTTTRRAVRFVAVGALAVGLVACGDDDDTDAGDGVASTEASTDPAAYCDDGITLDQMFQNFNSDDPAVFEEQLAAAVPVTERIVAAAPAELADEYAAMSDAFAEVVETGDPTPFFTPEVQAASDVAHAYDLAHCGWSVAEITAEDFHFSGTFPSEPGATSFEMVNTGVEAHALIVGRKLDSVQGAAIDAFNALESEEAFIASFEQTAMVFAEPGQSGYALADLAPGEYVAFCPVPAGTTSETAPGDGPPHFAQGMVTSFEVAAPSAATTSP